MKKIFCLLLLACCLCMAGCGDEEASSVLNSPAFEGTPPTDLVVYEWLSGDGTTETPVLRVAFDVFVPKTSVVFLPSINGIPAPTLAQTVVLESGSNTFYVFFGSIGPDAVLSVDVKFDVTDPAENDLIWTTSVALLPVYTGPVTPPPVVP